MTEKNKRGRPERMLEGLQARNSWNEICQIYPKLAEFEVKMLNGQLTANSISSLFDEAYQEMLSRMPAQSHRPERARSREQQLLSAAENFRAASIRLALARQLQGSVAKACSEAEITAQRWKDQMLATAVVSPPPDASAVDCAARLFKATGLTSAISRRITDFQLEPIAAIIKTAPEDDTPAPFVPVPPMLAPMTWTADNAWVSMPRQIPGYRLKEVEVSASEPGLAAVHSIGLPPFNDLAEYRLDQMLAAFKIASTNRDKRRECWALLSHWLQANRVEGWNGPATMKLREQNWVFLFAVEYGFTDGVAEFRTARFASPWREDAVILAERVRSVRPRLIQS